MEPPDDQICDISVGVDYPEGERPQIRRCSKPATDEIFHRSLPFEIWVCHEHAVQMLRQPGYMKERPTRG